MEKIENKNDTKIGEKMNGKIIAICLITLFFISMINSSIVTEAEDTGKNLIKTFTANDWENYDSSHKVQSGLLYTDYGDEDETSDKGVHIKVKTSCGLLGHLKLTQKAWHTVYWTTNSESNFQFSFDYSTWGNILLEGMNYCGINTGWCNVTVFFQVKDIKTGSYWINYERCVAAKSDILFPIKQNFDENTKFSSRTMHMTEGRELLIKSGIIVKNYILAELLAAEGCDSNIYGKMNSIKIYSDYNPNEPILSIDPDPPNHDFGTQYRGIRIWSFNVFNTGGGSLGTYEIYTECSWIQKIIKIPISGSYNYWKNFLIFNTTGLDEGQHQATFEIQSDYGHKTGTIKINIINAPPYSPHNPLPENEIDDAIVDPDYGTVWLFWNCSDVDKDQLSYKAYFGNNPEGLTRIQNQIFIIPNGAFTYVRGIGYGETCYWKVISEDDRGHSTEGPIWTFKTNLRPNKPDKPIGKKQGSTEKTYTYKTSTTDPNGHNLFYKFDWGDGTESAWLGPYESGGTVEASHSWDKIDDYNIKVKAKDSRNGVSEWSESLEVSMPKVKSKSVKSQILIIIEKLDNLYLLSIIRQLIFAI
jgi:hypothetical protein